MVPENRNAMMTKHKITWSSPLDVSKPLINTVLPDLGADLLKEPLSLLSNTLNSGHIDNDW